MDSVSDRVQANIESVKAYFADLELDLPKDPDGTVSLENQRLKASWDRQRESMLAACLDPQNIILLPKKFLG